MNNKKKSILGVIQFLKKHKYFTVLAIIVLIGLYYIGVSVFAIIFIILIILLLVLQRWILATILIIIGFLIMDVSFPYQATILDASVNEPVTGIEVFYTFKGPFYLSIGHPIQATLKSGIVYSNKDGKFIIPLYLGFNPFSSIENKYVIINDPTLYNGKEMNWFYETTSWTKLPINNETFRLKRNEPYFYGINNLKRANAEYGFCRWKQEEDVLRYINLIYNTKEEEKVQEMYKHYGFKEAHIKIQNYQIEGDDYNCFIISTDKPAFKLNHHFLSAIVDYGGERGLTSRTYYPEVVKYLYFNGNIYDAYTTDLGKKGVGGSGDNGFFFWTTNALENASNVYYNRNIVENCSSFIKGFSECNYNNAFFTNDTEYCEKSGKFKSSCYYYFAQLFNNSQLCNRSEEYEEKCYYEFAIKLKDVSLCQYSISNEEECNLLLGDRNKVIQICNSKEKEQSRTQCLWKYGIEREDTFLCEISGDYEANCYYRIALKTNNSELCEKSGYWSKDCLKETS